MEGEQGADGLPRRIVIDADYVAEKWRIFIPGTPAAAIRNIILAATYTQRCCIQHLCVHARRGLKEIFDSNGSPIAKAGLKRIAQLYKIEDKIRGESPATRQFVRWTESAPLVNAFGVWLDEQRSRVSPRSRLGEKLTYIANQWDGLLVFLYDGRVEMDTNFVENRIRPIKLTQKTRCSPAMTKGPARGGVSPRSSRPAR